MRVFIADDSTVLQECLVALLSDLKDIQVVGQARDVPGAIEFLRQLEPEVVILDIRMPGGSGIEVLRSIRAASPKPPPFVIILTNYPYPQYRKECEEAGADFFLDKSTEFERIAEILEELSHTPPWQAK